MEPRVSKRERKLHLSYDLPHRVHSAQLYPIPSANGSTILIYAHDRGLRLLWRGGKRRRRQEPPSRTNGSARDQDIIIIDDDDANEPQLQDELEDDEDELDPDCPYPPIISSVDIDFGAEVLHLAIPSLPPILKKSHALHNHGAIAISLSDGSQRVLTFSLLPPTNPAEYANDVLARQILLNLSSVPCTGLAAKIATSQPGDNAQSTSFLLVAASSDMLRTYRFAIFNDLTSISQDAETGALNLLHEVKSPAFHPSSSSTLLLLSDASGAMRICDPFTTPNSGEDGSAEMLDTEGTRKTAGKWLFAFTTPYTSISGAVARRKQVLASSWVLNGTAILALLEDGEWCIWNLAPTEQTGGNFSEPTLRAFLGTSTGTQAKSTSRLAPMTPNTRKSKSENFFAGPTKPAGSAAAAPQGGVSVVSSSLRANLPDESVILWYNGEIYSIPSLQTFWQRSTRITSNGGGGGLYAPGLTHITDINLGGERVTSISQFAPTAASSGVGQMNTQRDLLVSGEHRFIILQGLRGTAPARGLFQEVVRDGEKDQRMLDFGQLDLGGIERVMDGMVNGEGRTRRVGFAR
ncbi:hypothetical protein LTR56_023408 [Elasticomyces elasticus]|nr:hypothetical protein LTR56_023408 [Elasticomyces elasticus]KAK3622754.1 hypothetical protein LTR22_024669 [Elasticomyces elasticus]KAK4921687.1 hypothetical protein LTR49_010978 [Elasticomyces elasticus]KAK5742903.1 hypothetical protein LTS12_024054 [Elasticomyces elasticus]